jgi:hypothetical protein
MANSIRMALSRMDIARFTATGTADQPPDVFPVCSDWQSFVPKDTRTIKPATDTRVRLACPGKERIHIHRRNIAENTILWMVTGDKPRSCCM